MRKHHQVRKGQIVRVIAIGKPGKGDSDEDIVVRIKADAPVLRPDEPVRANPVR
jgi:hypothetical protein